MKSEHWKQFQLWNDFTLWTKGFRMTFWLFIFLTLATPIGHLTSSLRTFETFRFVDGRFIELGFGNGCLRSLTWNIKRDFSLCAFCKCWYVIVTFVIVCTEYDGEGFWTALLVNWKNDRDLRHIVLIMQRWRLSGWYKLQYSCSCSSKPPTTSMWVFS